MASPRSDADGLRGSCRGTRKHERKKIPVGFHPIRLVFDLVTDDSEEQLATLIRLTERYCVALQTLRNSPEVSVSRNTTGATA
jgi:uncharacterized OsmC-like protein